MAILVTGATGNVGRQVVTQLLGAGESVRAATRDPGRARLPIGGSGAANPSPIEVVRVDLAESATLEGKLAGVDSVFLVWPFLTADAAPAVVDVLRRHVRHVVYLSSAGVREDEATQSDPITQFHADVERLLVASGVGWTFLRPSGFATNNLGWAEQIRSEGVVREPFAGTRRSMIHEADIAAVAVLALVGGPSGKHVGAKYHLTGSEATTASQRAAVIGEAIGRPVRFEELSASQALDQLLALFPADVVNGMLDAWARMAEVPEAVTSTVADLTGRPARTFAQWAADHADDFR